MLGPPFVDAKRAALQGLVDRVASGDGAGSVLRVHAKDPMDAATDGRRLVWLVTGSGHGGDLIVQAWTTGDETMVCHEFELRTGPARSRFPQDDASVVCRRHTLPVARYRELIAGLRTVLDAELHPWWSGPGWTSTCSSYNFVVSIGGVDAAGEAGQCYCGYMGSTDRARYEKLLAGAQWHREFLARHGVSATVEVTSAARRCFSAVFLAEQSAWQTSDAWWVRQGMVEMARDLGDASLLAPLARLVEPKPTSLGELRWRFVAAAVNALVAISGVDERFHPDGTPRSVADVAALYHQRFAR